MKKLLLFVVAAVLSVSAYAQRQPVTEADYQAAERFTPAKLRQMVYSLNVQPNWLEKSNRFWYTYRTSEGMNWYLVDPDRGTKRLMFDNAKMAADLTRILKDPYDAQHLPIRDIRFTADETAFRFTVESKVETEEELNRETGKMDKDRKKKYVFEYNVSTGKLTHLEDYKTQRTPSWGSLSPDGQHVVFVKGFNLWYMDRENYDKACLNEADSTIVERQLTTDGIRYFGYASSRMTSDTDEKKEAEKRKNASITWSPDSRNFIVGKTDERDVKDLWVIRHTARPRPTLETYRYHMPGEKEAPQQYLYIFEMASGQMRNIDAGAFKDQTVGIINGKPVRTIYDDYTLRSSVWMGSNDEFFFTRMSRDLKRMDICRVDVETLSVKTIIEERFNTYLETRGLRLTNGPGSDIIHWSEEDGWAHLYLYGWDGERKNRITSGPWHVDNILHVDPAARTIYFVAQGREKDINPYYNFLYRVNFDGTGLKLLTPGDFTHEVNMHERMRYFVDNRSRNDSAPVSTLCDVTGRKVMDLEEADMSRLFEAGYKFPKPFKVKAADGITDLYGTLYYPYDLDSTRMYPIIEYVYPGPQVEGPTHTFHAPSYRLDQLAQLGFIVVSVGNRGGHPSRSKWYHTYGYGNLRDYGLADQKAAAIQLADRYPFIDITKVGITGHSGGGFMSTAAILQYPDFFKVAVSCAGNHDNAVYNRWWSEKHHGVKEEVNEQKQDTTFKYSIANNQQIAPRLKGRLLLVTGDVDNNVHPANTILVVDALIKAGKRFDMLVLPGQAHSFGNMTDYFFWRMADYFSEYLIGDSENSVDIPQLRE